MIEDIIMIVTGNYNKVKPEIISDIVELSEEIDKKIFKN